MAQTIKLKRSATQGASPTTSQLELGEVAINTYDGKMYIKKNVGGTESIVEVGAGGGSGGGLSSSFTLYEYTATANQTTFSGSDSNSNTLAYDTGTPPKILVYLNGVLLDHTTDYTATNGTSVVLTSGAAANDLVQVAAYKSESSVALDIALDDDVKLKLGDDDDLQIYHDGSTNNSVIKETGSGNLELWGNNVKIMNVAGTETQLNANPNGQVELYYDNSKKLETTSSGIQVQGAMASTTGTYSPIYYGGSSSLQLKSNSGELFGQFTNNGAAELYYDNTKKFETTSTGATITGNIAVTGTVDGRDLATDGSKLDNIESNADVTDTANVTAAGALMDSEVTNLAQVKAFDSSDYATAAQGTTADSAMQDLVDDTTPQLGGNLDLNSNNITGTGNISNTGTITSTSNISGSNLNVTSTNWLGWGDYGERISGSNANSSLTFSTDATTALTLDSSQNATFAGTISSGAIIASSGADQILTLDQFTAGWNYIGFSANGTRKFYVGNGAGTEFVIGSDDSGVVLDISNFGSVDFNSANITAAGTISSGAITSTGSSSIGSQTLYVSTDNYVGINTSSHVGTVLNVFDVDDEDVTLRLHTNTNSHQPVLRMNAKNSAGNPQYADIKYNPDSPSLNFHVPYNESTPTLKIFDGGVTIDGTISSGNITTSGYLAGPATFTIDPAAVGDNTGTVVIAGNLQVDGTTTTINSTTLTVDDIRITLARNAANAAAANGGGIELDGANASILYDSTNDEWDFNKNINVTGAVVSSANGGITTASGTTARFSVSETGGATTAMDARGSTGNIGTRSNHTLGFLVNDVQKATLTAGGDFTVTNDLKLTTTNPRIDYDNNGSGALRFYSMSAAQERMRITSGGKIGAGVLNPQYLLHLNGGATRTDVQVTLNGYGVGASNGAQFGIQTQGVYIWNFENTDLYFATNNQRRLTINEDGNVGIGTDSPQEKLHVYTTGDSRVEAESTTGFAAFKATNNSGSYAWYVDNSADKFHLFDFTDSANRITVDGSGNVGIGTTSPDYKLDIEGSGNGLIVARVKNITAGTSARADMLVESDASDIRMIAASSQYTGVAGWADTGIINTSSGTSGGMVFNVQGSYPIRFTQSVTNERLRIHTNGNVGIGTTSPTEILHVKATNGSIAIDANGSGNTASIKFINDNERSRISSNYDTGGGGRLTFHTDTTSGSLLERMRIDSSGRVGIGTISPSKKLHVKDGDVLIQGGTGTTSESELGFTNAFDTAFIRSKYTNPSSTTETYLAFHTNTAGDTNGTVSEKMRIAGDKVGIGTTSPEYILDIGSENADYPTDFIRLNPTNGNGAGTSNTVGTGLVWKPHYTSYTKKSAGIVQVGEGNYFRSGLAFYTNNTADTTTDWSERMRIDMDGNVGIGETSPAAKLQVEELGIDTTTTSTSATTQVAIDTFAAATFRSARYTIQVTNSTDSTYHLTEVLLIHDGTTPQITEYGTIFTGSAEATFDADISSGNVRLLATPATTDSMTFKVVRHCITV